MNKEKGTFMNRSFHINGKQALLTVTGICSLALMAGCCSRSGGQAYYSRPGPAYASTGTSTTQQYAEQSQVQQVQQTESSQNTGIPLYEESLNVGKREVEAGSVRLRKIVRTETVSQPIELRHEELVIDREPA